MGHYDIHIYELSNLVMHAGIAGAILFQPPDYEKEGVHHEIWQLYSKELQQGAVFLQSFIVADLYGQVKLSIRFFLSKSFLIFHFHCPLDAHRTDLCLSRKPCMAAARYSIQDKCFSLFSPLPKFSHVSSFLAICSYLRGTSLPCRCIFISPMAASAALARHALK